MARRLYANAKEEIVELRPRHQEKHQIQEEIQLREGRLPVLKYIIRVLARPDREGAMGL
jgi:hypothetical protein